MKGPGRCVFHADVFCCSKVDCSLILRRINFFPVQSWDVVLGAVFLVAGLLYRFYSQDSSFVHGGPEKQECVMGQHDIHQRIMQLNFRDCHAKIKQVDSLTTLGEGVVIQVSCALCVYSSM